MNKRLRESLTADERKILARYVKEKSWIQTVTKRGGKTIEKVRGPSEHDKEQFILNSRGRGRENARQAKIHFWPKVTPKPPLRLDEILAVEEADDEVTLFGDELATFDGVGCVWWADRVRRRTTETTKRICAEVAERPFKARVIRQSTRVHRERKPFSISIETPAPVKTQRKAPIDGDWKTVSSDLLPKFDLVIDPVEAHKGLLAGLRIQLRAPTAVPSTTPAIETSVPPIRFGYICCTCRATVITKKALDTARPIYCVPCRQEQRIKSFAEAAK